MKNYIIIILFIGLLSCNADYKIESDFSSDPIDVEHQVINLKFDWNKNQVFGTTDISLKTLKKTNNISLDVGMLKVNNVMLKGNTDLTFTIDKVAKNNELNILLDRTYKKNEQITLIIDYRTNWINHSDPNNIWGSFGKGIRFFDSSFTEKDRRKQAWAFGEPESSKYWFPHNNDIRDLRTTEFVCTVKKPLMVISNGILKEIQDNGDSTRTYHWETSNPYANHLTSFAVGEYKNYKQQFEDVEINNYGYPDEFMGTKESVLSLPEMMKYYSSYTGKKYPYDKYSQIFVQDFGGWKGNMMSSMITENMIDDKTTHEDFLYLWDVAEGEALAFQWFGNYIKPSSWNDVWLTKAFCRHLSGLYNQHKNGNEEYQIYQHNPDLNTYLSDWNSGKPTVIVPDSITNNETFVNSNAPYTKGALVLNMLRNELGNEKWQKLIKSYVSSFGDKHVSTKDFIKKVNKVNGTSLNWFFEQWVYAVGHPKFKIEKAFNKQANKLELIVTQNQKVDSLVYNKKIPFFRGKIYVEIDGEIIEKYLDAKKENILEFSLDTEPKLINFDYQDVWIKESEFEKSNQELILELTQTNDILHRVSSMSRLTQIAKESTTANGFRDKTITQLFTIAESDMYWRNKLFAIWQLHNIFTTISEDGIARLNNEQETRLIQIINTNTSWVKANAINFLGDTRDKKHVQIYLDGLKDYSDRVTFMSAIALGKSQDDKAFTALKELPKKPSWKNQSLISAMYGFKELKDTKSYDIVLKTLTDSKNPHWNLATPVWDHRLAAAHALVALNKVDEAYDVILTQFNDAMANGNINDIFYNALQISILGDSRGEKVFTILKEKFKEDIDATEAIKQLEVQFNNSTKN